MERSAEHGGAGLQTAGDNLIPDLMLDGAEELEEMPLGKCGMLRETFLEDHHHGTYTSMLLTGRLYLHLREIDRQAQEQVDRMVADLKKRNGVDEAMKARDQMRWVQAVNSFTAQAEQVVLAEIVYK
nr:TnpV protein [uncultured Oscillibacter sp.]